MRYNKLGSTGLFVSELALGTMTFGADGTFEAMGHVAQDEADAMMALALERGVNFIDTADAYSSGASERIVGRGLKNLNVRRDEVVVATKVFAAMGDGPNDRGSSRAHVLSGLRASLERLETDYIDLYQLHGFDPATPIEESLGALDDAVRRGDVRYVGVSNWAAWQIAKALGVCALRQFAPLAAVQAYYSLAGRDLEREMAPLLVNDNVGLIVWSPLAGGLLSGTISRARPTVDGTRRSALAFPPVDLERAYDVIDVLERIALRKGVTIACLAIAWLLVRPVVTSVVLGARRLDQLADTLGAGAIDFDEDELAELDRASRLPSEYPGWMIDLWSAARVDQLAATRHGDAVRA